MTYFSSIPISLRGIQHHRITMAKEFSGIDITYLCVTMPYSMRFNVKRRLTFIEINVLCIVRDLMNVDSLNWIQDSFMGIKPQAYIEDEVSDGIHSILYNGYDFKFNVNDWARGWCTTTTPTRRWRKTIPLPVERHSASSLSNLNNSLPRIIDNFPKILV